MINNDTKSKLIVSLLSMFQSASSEAAKMASRLVVAQLDDSDLPAATQEALRQYQEKLPAVAHKLLNLIPQACALMLSTGQIVGGVAANPITFNNLQAEDAVSIAQSTLDILPGLMKTDFQIVAVALTTTTDQAPNEVMELFEYSLSQLPNLKAHSLILVDPFTQKTQHSAPFSDYRIL